MMTARADLVLKNVLCPDGRHADLSIRGGKVVHSGSPLPTDVSIDCRGKIVIPGGIDMHVHMRGGERQRHKEDWGSGSRSALAGGVTVVVDQPNTVPPVTNGEILAARVNEALCSAVCGFAINGGVVPGSDIVSMWRRGAMAFGEIFAGPSSYGEAVPPEALREFLRIIRGLGALATVHAEQPAGTGNNLEGHDRARPASGEIAAIGSVSRAAPKRSRLHFCHLSTEEAVRTARKCGGTTEVTPHHLFLSYESFGALDARAKVNPPLRSDRERKEIWSVWDQIDVIASDHAPHTPAEKAAPFREAPSGMPGVETMLPLLVAASVEGRISLQSVMEKTSWKPAELLGIPASGFYPGQRADFAIFSGDPEPIEAGELHCRAGWTPFAGLPGCGVETVIRDGAVAYRSGEFSPLPPVWYKGRGYNRA